MLKKGLAMLLALVMLLSCLSGIAAMQPMGDPFYQVLHQTDYSEHASEIVGTDMEHGPMTQISGGSGYVKMGEDYWFIQCSNAAQLSKWSSPVGNNKISDTFTGEYVVSYNMMYANYPYQNSWGQAAVYFTYDNKDLSKSFMGYELNWDTSGVSTVNFKTRYKDTVDTSVKVGTWEFTSGEWYTYRQIFNLDKKVATLKVYNKKGEEVASFEHELQASINGTTIPYTDLTTSSLFTASKARGLVAVTDHVVAKTIAQPVTAEFDEEMVSVTYGGKDVVAGEAVAVAYGSDAKFTVKAKDDCVIKGIKVDGKTVDSLSEVALADVKEPHEIEVITKAPSRFKNIYKTLYTTDFSENADSIVGEDKTHAELTQLASGYVKLDGKYYLYQCSNAALLSKWFSPVGNKKVSADKTGEYVITYKSQYTNYPYQQSYAAMSTHLTYDNADLSKSFMGFHFSWDVNGDATVGFRYRYKDTVDTVIPVGTWKVTSGEWYTYRQVYSFDKMTAEVYIIDSKDNQVGYFKHDLQSEVNGTAIPYKDVTTSSIYTESKSRGLVLLTDYTFEQKVAVPVTFKYNEKKVNVVFDDITVPADEEVLIAYNNDEKSVFNIETEDGVTINKILVNGKEAEIKDVVELSSVIDPTTVEIIAEEAPVVKSLTIEGAAQTGKTISAVAVIEDVNGDITSALYQWQFLDGSEWKDISGATSKDFADIPDTYLGKKLRVKVTPVSDKGLTPGEPEYAETLAVSKSTVPPSAENTVVSGTADVGYTVNVDWKYVVSESNIEEGDSLVIFEVADTKDGVYTPVQQSTEKSFYISNDIAGKWLRIRVIPKDAYGVAGETVTFEPTLIAKKMALFVAADGSDKNDGSIEKPFATIEKARDTIRAMETLPEGGVVVNVRGGTYPTMSTIKFDSVDSGTADSPIVYQAYNNEKVVFTGGKVLDTSKIQKVTDKKILDKLVEEDAKDHLYMLDLKEQGVTMHELKSYGRGYSGYTPKMLTMNNTVLTEARWPNDDQSQYLVKCRPLTAKDGIDEDKINTDNTPIMYEYPDPENRSAKWDIKKGDAYVGGAVVFFWAQVNLLIDNIDVEKKVVTSLDASTYASVKGVGWGPQYKVYFSNIFAEIDRPGEHYVDRENGILYFYPVGSVENAEMSVSESNATMVLADDLKYVTFKGFTMKDTSGALLYFRRGDNIRVEDCELSNAGSGISISDNTKNSVFTGNHLYNLNGSGMSFSGAKMDTLEKQNNLVENNNFHTFSLLRTTPYGIYMSGAIGNTIRNNEFNDFCQGAMLLENAVLTTIEYNKIINGAQSATDMGAIYWGRNPISVGNVVRYNYFENIGSEQISHVLEGGHTYGIFNDDGTTSGHIYGNVFFDGGTGTGITGNGAEFGKFENNVFISTNTERFYKAININTWGSRPERYDYVNDKGQTVKMKDKIPARVWLYLMDLRTPLVEPNGNTNTWASRQGYAWSETWINEFKGTQWERTFDYYSKKNYDAVKAYADAGNREGMLQYLDENLPAEWTNEATNNLVLNGLPIEAGCGGMDIRDNYIGTSETITDAQKALFVDYDNKNFTLTDAGLAEVRKSAPKFQQIPFDKIGLLTDVGGSKPVVTVNENVVEGKLVAGNTITASYTFSDADGDLESTTKIYWYTGSSANGKFTKVQAAEGKNFKLEKAHAGKYIKYEVVPYDTHSLRGETVMSEPVYVRFDSTTADARIAEIEAELSKAVAGTELGNYPANAIETLSKAVETAKAAIASAKNETAIEDAMKTLERAFTVFKNKVVKDTGSDDEEDNNDTPSGGGSSSGGTVVGGGSSGGGGGGGGSSSGGGNKVTYDGGANNVQPVDPTPSTPSTSDKFVFDDVKGHWSEADVMAMFDAGIVSGVSETTFEPDRKITRAEFATLIAKALKLEEGEADFADVNDEWFAPFVGAAAKAGIIAGSDGAFRPNDTITRQEMAVIVVKAYEYLEKTAESAELTFADAESIATWATEYVAKAVGAGLISGMGDNMFAPAGDATRAQAASVISRIIK